MHKHDSQKYVELMSKKIPIFMNSSLCFVYTDIFIEITCTIPLHVPTSLHVRVNIWYAQTELLVGLFFFQMSAITVGCLDAYKKSVDTTCDSVDSSIKVKGGIRCT